MASRSVPFVHLHNHSQYSLLDGASRLDDLVRRTSELGMPALAVTDHGNLFNVVRFCELARRHEVRAIIGCEVYVAPGSRRDRGPVAGMKQAKPYYHLILLAKNRQGYQNLIRLVSAGFIDGFYYKPRIDRELMQEYHEGLIALSGCLGGEVAQHLLHGRPEPAEEAARWYRDTFGEGRYYLELQRHEIDGQEDVVNGKVDLARQLGVPLVATNDCHYLERDDHAAHDVLLCIQTGKTVNQTDRMRYTGDHYFKTGAEMAEVFGDLREAIDNTVAIAEQCDFELETGGHLVPKFPVPDERSIDEYFADVVRDGFEERRQRWDELAANGELRHPLEDYRTRLEDEIATIQKMGFSGYFLIVWDFMRYAREAKIPVGPGRGSAAGSLVAFCMWITNIDPLQYDLLFERFLNPERVTMPDIDIDFCMRGRADVIRYVTEKYGRDNVAQIITFGTMAARAVIRDVGRAMDFSYAEVDRIAKLVPAELDATIDKALADVDALQQLCDEEPRVAEMIGIARKLEGLTRHASTHAAGVVISPKAITEFCPLYKDPKKDEVTTQWAKDEVESIGLLKMDFLGLKTLTLMADTLRRIQQSEGGEAIDLDALPLDDEATYRLFCVANTAGVFQFESSGMQDILRRLKPERFEDLIALNALYRPGPIKSGMIDDFIQRRHGKIPVEYPHPALEEVLSPTYGVIVYQEQVMRIASVMAGYSLGEADILRRAMGKKKVEVMNAQQKKFVSGAEERNITRKEAESVFELVGHFAGYGFNKSHSAAYALIAYQTAYLKSHYPRHFMASLLTTDADNSDKVKQYIQQCRDMKIEVLPPDVNASELDFSVEGDAIRYGMCAIKNVGHNAAVAVVEARERVGRFESLAHACQEVDPKLCNKRVWESLIKGGAFDRHEPSRARLLAGLESALEAASRHHKDRDAGQGSLFGAATGTEVGPPRDVLPQIADWSTLEMLANEKEALGLYMTGHPLAEHSRLVEQFASHDSSQVAGSGGAGGISLAGVIGAFRRRKTRKGNQMATFSLEDMNGATEVVVFPDLLSKRGEIIEDEAVVLVSGRADAEEERARIVADEIVPLEQAWERPVESLTVELASGSDDARLDELGELLRRHRGPTPVVFKVVGEELVAWIRADRRFNVRAQPDLVDSVENLIGDGRVRLRLRPPARESNGHSRG